MARPLLLSLLAVCFLASIHGSFGQGRSQYQGMNECQINRLDAVEPTNQIQCEAGLIETWDHNHQMFQCAGVAVVRYTIEPNGLLLPNFINSPQLIHIIEGEQGLQGIVIPGCPETYQMSQQQSESGQQGQGEWGQSGRGEGGRFQQDRHQKVRRFRQGDVIALPNGVAHWIYNDGNRPIVAVILLDISSNLNQLDINPRRFYLAGNPEDEHQHQQGGHSWQGQSGRGGQTRRSQQIHQAGGQFGGSRGGECNNIFCGFDAEFLAEAFNVDIELARRLQGENDNRNNIVRVEGGSLQVLRPPVRAEWEEETQRETQRYRGRGGYGGGRRGWEGQRYPGRGGYGVNDNGVEETLCAMRLRENIGDPSRADVYVPQVGHVSTLNSHNLPILFWLQLSAERGSLQSNAMVAPLWNLNAHSVMYAISGRARIQIVNDNGQSVFDDELREGQIVVVPQNFAVAKRAESEGFEWIAFKTSDNTMISPLAGRTSVIRALPDEVVANAYQVSKEDARRLKYSRRETTLFSPTRGAFSQRRADA